MSSLLIGLAVYNRMLLRQGDPSTVSRDCTAELATIIVHRISNRNLFTLYKTCINIDIAHCMIEDYRTNYKVTVDNHYRGITSL